MFCLKLTGIPTAVNGLPYAYNYAPYVAPVAPAATQFNSADEFGNINYGYSNINSAKHEAGNAYGGVTGSYSYVDANGLLQTVNYIADDFGFRVAATNLPVAKSVELEQPVFDLVGPAPVEDTEEVKAAKAEFEEAFAAAQAASLVGPAPVEDTEEVQAASRKRRSEEIATIPASTAPLAFAAPIAPAFAYAAAPATLAYAHAPFVAAAPAPLTYATAPVVAAAPVVSAPAAREAVLTKIQLNPGHAVAYIVN